MNLGKAKEKVSKHMMTNTLTALLVSWEEIGEKATTLLTEILGREVYVKPYLEQTDCWSLQIVDGWITQDEIVALFDVLEVDAHDRDGTFFEENNITELTESVSVKLFSPIVPFKIERWHANDDGVCFISSNNYRDNLPKELLTRPMLRTEVLRAMDEDGYIEGVVALGLSELICGDYDRILDLCVSKMVEHQDLTDIEFEIVGHSLEKHCDDIYLLVSGHVEDLDEYIDSCDNNYSVELGNAFLFKSEGNPIGNDMTYRAVKINEYGDYYVFRVAEDNGTLTADKYYTEAEVKYFIGSGEWVVQEARPFLALLTDKTTNLDCDLIIGGAEMPASFVWDEDCCLTEYGIRKFGDLLFATYEILDNGNIEIFCDDDRLGEDFVLAAAGHIGSYEYALIFGSDNEGNGKQTDKEGR